MVLGIAQFLMVLDSAVMNVSVSQIVEDFDTEVTAVQFVITFYSLVMAATMITGGKLGDRLGRRRAFRIGLVIYGFGSALTAVSWSMPVLLVGWSVLEGLGAALVLPALAALVGGTYEGSQRTFAYGVLGGLAGTGVAVGPIVGGFFTATLSWRWVFVGEALIVAGVLLVSGWLDEPERRRDVQVDVVGAILSAAGLVLVVLGMLQSSSWGWLRPRNSPVEIAGLALTPFVMGAGALLLWAFTIWQQRMEGRGRQPLVRLSLLDNVSLRAGLNSLFVQNTVLLGLFFMLPLYLQLTQGFDALETGIRLLPMSIMMMVFSMAGPAIERRMSARTAVRIGLLVLTGAGLLLIATIDAEIDEFSFAITMGVLGIGVGILASQLGNVIQSSVGDEDRSEVGGLQYTWLNLGSAVGTALAGSVLIGALSTAFVSDIAADERIPAEVRSSATSELQAGVPFVSASEVETALAGTDLDAAVQTAIVESYRSSQLVGLRTAVVLVVGIGLVGLFFTRGLPNRRRRGAAVVPEPVGGAG